MPGPYVQVDVCWQTTGLAGTGRVNRELVSEIVAEIDMSNTSSDKFHSWNQGRSIHFVKSDRHSNIVKSDRQQHCIDRQILK